MLLKSIVPSNSNQIITFITLPEYDVNFVFLTHSIESESQNIRVGRDTHKDQVQLLSPEKTTHK